MEHVIDAVQTMLLVYLGWKQWAAKTPALKDIVRQALADAVKDGSGRERLRARLAAKRALLRGDDLRA